MQPNCFRVVRAMVHMKSTVLFRFGGWKMTQNVKVLSAVIHTSNTNSMRFVFYASISNLQTLEYMMSFVFYASISNLQSV